MLALLASWLFLAHGDAQCVRSHMASLAAWKQKLWLMDEVLKYLDCMEAEALIYG